MLEPFLSQWHLSFGSACLTNPTLGGAPFSISTWTTEHSEKLTVPYGIQMSDPRSSQALTLGTKHTHALNLFRHTLAIFFFILHYCLSGQSLDNAGDLRPTGTYKLVNLLLLIMFPKEHK